MMIDINNPDYSSVVAAFATKIHEYSQSGRSLTDFFSKDRAWIRSMIELIAKSFDKDFREVDNDIADRLNIIEGKK